MWPPLVRRYLLTSFYGLSSITQFYMQNALIILDLCALLPRTTCIHLTLICGYSYFDVWFSAHPEIGFVLECRSTSAIVASLILLKGKVLNIQDPEVVLVSVFLTYLTNFLYTGGYLNKRLIQYSNAGLFKWSKVVRSSNGIKRMPTVVGI